MLDQGLIGRVLGRRMVCVERGAVRAFAHATGETDPVYFDESAARAAGLRSLRVPATFLSSLERQVFPSKELVELAGLNAQRILHAAQSYVYHQATCAGDSLVYEPRIAEVYDKKNGALSFLVKETRVSTPEGVHVADLRTTWVQNNSIEERP
jgi:hypothetical protein